MKKKKYFHLLILDVDLYVRRKGPSITHSKTTSFVPLPPPLHPIPLPLLPFSAGALLLSIPSTVGSHSPFFPIYSEGNVLLPHPLSRRRLPTPPSPVRYHPDPLPAHSEGAIPLPLTFPQQSLTVSLYPRPVNQVTPAARLTDRPKLPPPASP